MKKKAVLILMITGIAVIIAPFIIGWAGNKIGTLVFGAFIFFGFSFILAANLIYVMGNRNRYGAKEYSFRMIFILCCFIYNIVIMVKRFF